MDLIAEFFIGWYSKVITPFAIIPMILFFLFMVKHLLIDFPLQGPYQYKNKGTYGHPGGLLHSGLHGIATLLILAVVTHNTWPAIFALAFFDFFAHYHIDWAKMNINKKMGWGPTTHEQFWWLLGVDQFAHMMTYWLIIGCTM